MDLKLTMVTDADNTVVGDIYLESGQPVWVTGSEAIAQHVWVRLRRFKGEWFLNLDEGIPMESVLGKAATVDSARRVLSRVILDTPGIATLDRIDVEVDSATRRLVVSNIEATTIEGVNLTADDFAVPFVVRP
jgi:hypothetical protein